MFYRFCTVAVAWLFWSHSVGPGLLCSSAWGARTLCWRRRRRSEGPERWGERRELCGDLLMSPQLPPSHLFSGAAHPLVWNCRAGAGAQSLYSTDAAYPEPGDSELTLGTLSSRRPGQWSEDSDEYGTVCAAVESCTDALPWGTHQSAHPAAEGPAGRGDGSAQRRGSTVMTKELVLVNLLIGPRDVLSILTLNVFHPIRFSFIK